MEDEQQRIHTDPADVRAPGPGGGETPAMIVNPNTLGEEVLTAENAHGRFRDSREADDVVGVGDQSEPRLYVPTEKISVAEMRENARDYYKDDSPYVLDVGTELFNKSGARLVLRSPAVIALDGATGNPHANDTKFAGFLHDSDTNWNLNIGQLDRKFNRATAAPLPFECEKHGEEIELSPYGAPRQCPKCAEERLAQAQAGADAKAATEAEAAKRAEEASQSEAAIQAENERQAAIAREEELRRGSLLREG